MPRGIAKGRAASEGQCEGARCISWRLLLLRRRRSVSASSLWRVTKCDVGAAPNLLLGRNEELDVAPNRLRERRQELIKAPCVLFRRKPDQSSRVPCCMRGDWPRRRSLSRERGQLKVAKSKQSPRPKVNRSLNKLNKTWAKCKATKPKVNRTLAKTKQDPSQK